jgi:hypothetical protein
MVKYVHMERPMAVCTDPTISPGMIIRARSEGTVTRIAQQ